MRFAFSGIRVRGSGYYAYNNHICGGDREAFAAKRRRPYHSQGHMGRTNCIGNFIHGWLVVRNDTCAG